jgi:cytochrome oxidase Cu insertion factor (SCO1/SenC/PrrC family)
LTRRRCSKAYGKSYQYDPAHWSFLTGPPDKIAELARCRASNYRIRLGRSINHNFRTLIVDGQPAICRWFFRPAEIFPIKSLSEIIKAAAVTNQPA